MFSWQLKIPQISPMNWFFLFLFFNLGFYLIIVKNYYVINKVIKSQRFSADRKKKLYFFEL